MNQSAEMCLLTASWVPEPKCCSHGKQNLTEHIAVDHYIQTRENKCLKKWGKKGVEGLGVEQRNDGWGQSRRSLNFVYSQLTVIKKTFSHTKTMKKYI